MNTGHCGREQGVGAEGEVRLKQARLDLVVWDGAQLWWVDFTCFHPFVGSGQRLGQRAKKWSLESREGLKHAHYSLKHGGRRVVANGQLVPVVANSYGAIGAEGRAFLSMLDRRAVVLGRDCARERLCSSVESQVIYFTASTALAAYGREVV